MAKSYPGTSLIGPVRPKPEMEQITSRGFRPSNLSGPTPSRSALAERKFSSTTSLCRTRSWKMANPSGRARSRDERFLVAVARQVISTERPDERRAPGAGFVSLAGAFDLDDFRPEITEDLPAQRPRQHARGIQDADAGQRAMGIGGQCYLLLTARCQSRLSLRERTFFAERKTTLISLFSG